MILLPHLLRRFVSNGRLTVIDHDGSVQSFGSGQDGPLVTMRLADDKVEREIFLNPELKTAEAYMDGRLSFEEGSTVYDLLQLFSVNRKGLGSHPVQAALRQAWRSMRRLHQANPLGKAAENVRGHYDHPGSFYALWLDERMAYSCAYFQTPDQSLEDAQVAKFRHIAAKLDLKPGMSVAEIGSGWGGLAIYLAKVCGVHVTAINVSPEQLAASRRKAEEAGATGGITFVEQDYRELKGTFDRVVSVGMMEHVGVAYFDEYFRSVKRLLKPGGFAMIHAIGRMSPPGSTAPFIRKYIFPGGYVPALSEVFASTERTGVWVADCEILRLHYYWTIKHWRERFMARRAEVVEQMGERFARMWEFYLVAVELGFLHGSNMVFQLLLAETRDAVPVIRDFITDNERALIEREREIGY
ncbi:SAM-dependent methyltransferase [Salinarimonas soli]|uniref:Class I SAM-dependent methyltransferase n=1 Tax=Salinarimonas soli TaxID=1638099 RepID=A0A5B2VH43_9HYPH|nr:cyclopropane-fatty-acyl-phospholipid synthase family protein [Salinarimonas soli]KAA2238214.1 class I SAM-dependent methyltransferase [Salinarimonas soli]